MTKIEQGRMVGVVMRPQAGALDLVRTPFLNGLYAKDPGGLQADGHDAAYYFLLDALFSTERPAELDKFSAATLGRTVGGFRGKILFLPSGNGFEVLRRLVSIQHALLSTEHPSGVGQMLERFDFVGGIIARLWDFMERFAVLVALDEVDSDDCEEVVQRYEIVEQYRILQTITALSEKQRLINLSSVLFCDPDSSDDFPIANPVVELVHRAAALAAGLTISDGDYRSEQTRRSQAINTYFERIKQRAVGDILELDNEEAELILSVASTSHLLIDKYLNNELLSSHENPAEWSRLSPVLRPSMVISRPVNQVSVNGELNALAISRGMKSSWWWRLLQLERWRLAVSYRTQVDCPFKELQIWRDPSIGVINGCPGETCPWRDLWGSEHACRLDDSPKT